MTSESKAWQNLKSEYLRQVEKALSSVGHPRARDVLGDVGSHLDRRLAELAPDQRTVENLRAIIAEMGPASEYAELLEPEGPAGQARTSRRAAFWGVLAASILIALAALVVVAMRAMPGPSDRIGAEALAAEAWDLWRQQKFAQAEVLFVEAVDKDPAYANPWNGLGWAQFNQGKPAAASTSFQKCLGIEPEHAGALNGLGWIAKTEDRIDDAIGYWHRVVKALPGATAALNGLATTYMETEQYDKAAEVYEQWLRVEPNNARAKANLEKAKGYTAGGPDRLERLIAELSDPNAPRFVALREIIKIGPSAVPTLIKEMKTSYNWQVPKALGAIADRRAVLPLIEKLEASDFSPMREVVAEALSRITGEPFGVSNEKWRTWWTETGQNMGQAVPSGGGVGRAREPEAIYIVTFKPLSPFAPQTAMELLDAFNENHPRGVRTHHYRTQVKDGALIGYICVDAEAGKDQVVSMLEKSERLEPVEIQRATDEQLRSLYAMRQVSLTSAEPVVVYIVTFKPAGGFSPQTARELLGAFNENHPRGVRTHHYRTQKTDDGTLIGSICVDTDAGKDAVLAMLTKSEKLESVQAKRATAEELEKRHGTSRGPSSGSPGPSGRMKEPTSRNRTVARSGRWPAGNGTLSGYVKRNVWPSRISHAKACLSAEGGGSWTVEVEDHGRFEFTGIPAGLYTLYTTDTFGYKDTYYNPQNQAGERPAFELRPGQRIQPDLTIEPVRPYRKIAGRILDESGSPPADCNALRVRAWVRKPQGPWKGHYRRLFITSVQADGSYLLDHLDGRDIYVQVTDPRAPSMDDAYPPRFYPGTFSRSQARLIQFGDDDIVEAVDIRMQRGGGLALTGTVTAEGTGEPVPEAMVSLFHHDMFFDLFATYTDAEGRYRFDGLGEGTFIVHIDAVHKRWVKTRKTITVEADADETRLDFTLRKGVRISGDLVDEQGKPWPRGRNFGHVHVESPNTGPASNFPYGNRYAPEHIRKATTIWYESGEGDCPLTMMMFPTETSFLFPAAMPGKTSFDFRPRGQGERLLKILYQDRDISRTGLVTEPGQDLDDVTIVVGTS